MEFDGVFDHIGHFGIYQLMFTCMLGMLGIFSGYQNMAMNFLGPQMDHWCKVDRLKNFTFEQQKQISIPLVPSSKGDGAKLEYSKCERYDYDFSRFTDFQLYHWNRTKLNVTRTIPCKEWVYDRTTFLSVATNEYNLVCDRSLLVQTTSTIYLAGFFIGAFLSGAISDKIGRKRTLLFFNALHLVFGIAAAFAPNYIAFVILRFFTGLGVTSAFTCGFVLFMEVIGPKWRMEIGVLYQVWFALGFMLLPALSYLIRDFRYLQLVMAAPALALLGLARTIPESPRWLILNKRKDEAMTILQYIAHVNGKTLPEKVDIEVPTIPAKEKKPTVLDLFKTPVLRNRTLALYLAWFTVSLLYYGLSLNAGDLSGNVHLNTFLMALIEVPANIICIILMRKAGRRWSVSGALIFAGIMMFGTIPLLYYKRLPALMTVLTLLGKAGTTVAFSGVYVWSAELFPTIVRNVGVGSSSTVSRIAGMISPYMGGPMLSIWLPLPAVIFGVFGVVSGLGSLTCPETLNKNLPETIEDAANFLMENKLEEETDF